MCLGGGEEVDNDPVHKHIRFPFENGVRLTVSKLCCWTFIDINFARYDPELFGKALPCLTAIACALPPDYSKSASPNGADHEYHLRSANGATETQVGPYSPMPIPTDK